MNPTTRESRQARALALHKEGYNCAQCVAMAFDDLTDIPSETLARMTASFGLGMADSYGPCGAISGAQTVRGLLHFRTPADKQPIYAGARDFTARFRDANGGFTVCRDLKGKGKIPCDLLITSSVGLLHDELCS